MPPKATKPVPRPLKLRDECAALCCSKREFYRRWHSTFTDLRNKDEIERGCERRVYEDEVALAVNEAANGKGKAAVLNYRRLMKRL